MEQQLIVLNRQLRFRATDMERQITNECAQAMEERTFSNLLTLQLESRSVEQHKPEPILEEILLGQER